MPFDYEKAVSHFKSKRERLESIDVPEWNSKIYFYRQMTFGEKAALAGVYQGAPAEVIIESLIQRARDETGALIWSNAARKSLRREYDPDILERVALAMNEQTDTVEDGDDRAKK